MTDALRYEATRIRTIRSTYWLVGLSIVTSAAIAFIVAFVTRDDALTMDITANTLFGGGEIPTFTPVLMAIMGILAVGHEYRYGTIQPTLTALPQRSTLLTAKILMLLAVAMATVLISLLVNLGIGMIFWSEFPDLTESPLNQALLGYFVYVAIYVIVGVGLAQLFRGVPSAIVVLLVTPLIVEGLIMGLSGIEALDWLVPAVKFLPFTAGDRLIAMQPMEAWPGAPDWNFFDRWASGGVFAAFAFLILAIAWYLFKKRDA
jgi:ABC-2 type transport system permease protein